MSECYILSNTWCACTKKGNEKNILQHESTQTLHPRQTKHITIKQMVNDPKSVRLEEKIQKKKKKKKKKNIIIVKGESHFSSEHFNLL
jgi:ATP adenylyltransferase/5',5'''-P-1,P-4-tetraphosphate phosphorylase II